MRKYRVNQQIEKYICKVCGVNTFQTKESNVINLALINKLCSRCCTAELKKITGG